MMHRKTGTAGRTLILTLLLLVSVFCLGTAALSAGAAAVGAAEEKEELSISIENAAYSGSEFSFDVCLHGTAGEGDRVIAALYREDGRMISARILDAAERVSVSFPQASASDSVRVMWTDSGNAPRCASASAACTERSIYESLPSKEHAVTGTIRIGGQEETVTYIDNEVLLEAADGTGREQVEEYVRQLGGRIAGEMKEIGHYQVVLDRVPDAEQYSSILEEMEKSGLFKGVCPNIVIDFEPCSGGYAPADPWGADPDSPEDWNEGFPSGANWGPEAVCVPSAWQMLCDRYGSLDSLPQIPVGIFDSCFDFLHDDLSFTSWAVRDTSAEQDPERASEVRDLAGKLSYEEAAGKGLLHGTQTAGIISAVHSSSGISGIAGSQPLYAYAYGPSEEPVTLSMFESGLGWLVEKSPDGKTVINVSLTDGQAGTAAAGAVSGMLKDYLDRGKDFLIVSAAGNGGADAAGAGILNSIEDPEIRSRIIVAGAAGRYDAGTGLFSFCRESGDGQTFNYGARIDVAAPGDGVLTTVPVTAGGSDTGLMYGTSAAAAHVTGTAALVWAAAPDLTGAKVKEILTGTADISLLEDKNGELVPSTDAGGNTHAMINAAHAAAEALGQPYRAGGTCGGEGDGSNLTWAFDFSSGTLTVSGTGEMQNFEPASSIPWHRWGREIRNIVVEDGVTSVGDNAFSCAYGRPSASFGKTVSKFGRNVFTQPADLVFAGSAPETADASSGSPSFAAGSAIQYPEENRDSWDPDGDGTWNGYSVQSDQAGKYSIAGSVISAETSEPVAGAEISILDREEKVVRSGSSDEAGKFELKLEFDPSDSILLIRKDGFVSLYLDLTAYPELTADLFEGTELAPEKMFSASGKCGKYLSWGLAADGTLCFSGSGDMDDFRTPVAAEDPGSQPPWTDLKDTVKAFRVLNGSSLTGIGNAAFYQCSGLAGSLTIPDSVTSIGEWAFADCSGLTGSLIIPDSVASIGGAAFAGCSGFTGSLVIPDSVTSIEDSAFAGCSGFDGSLTIPDSVTSIEIGAFSDCFGFTGSLTIPDSVTSIGRYAFYHCFGFTGDLIIPDSVTSIAEWAFYSCFGFTGDLIIPDSVTSIESRAFEGCSGFTGSLTIPDSVTSIGGGAFAGCSGFTGDLIIPDSVTSIESGAFRVCSGFTGSLVIPDSVASIGQQAFYGCSGFTGDLVIPGSVTSIGESAFKNCSGFTGSLVIPGSVTSIEGSAFAGCSGFTGSLAIPGSVTSIGGWAFHGCSGFSGDLIIPDSVASIGDYAFWDCSGLTGDLTIPGSVTSIGSGVFDGCSGFDGSLTIPDSVTSIGEYAFKGCSGFTGDLVIPDSVTSIGVYAFDGCGFADAWFFGGRLDGAFFGLPDSCRIHYSQDASGWPADDLDGYAQEPFNPEEFSPGQPSQPGQTGKYSIAGSVISAETSEPVAGAEISILGREENVVLSGTADETGKFELRMDFDPADSILLIRKDGLVSLYLDLTAYPELPADLFEGTELAPEKMFSASGECGSCLSWGLTADGTLCFSGSGNMEDFRAEAPWSSLKDTVKTFRVLNGSRLTSIGDYAFYGSGLTGGLTIPDSVTSIGDNAFQNCSGLTGDLTIPESVASLGRYAFSGCSGFSGSLTIPGSLERIDSCTFYGCSGLTGSLTIPDKVTGIGDAAFFGCSGFTGSLTIQGSVTRIGISAFSGCSGFTGSLVIPESAASIEERAFFGCSGFDGSLTMPGGASSIGNSAFEGCSGFTGSLVIPESAVIIGDSAFKDCSGFTGSLTIPGSVTSIGDKAFSGCSGLTGGLTIPDSVAGIGWGAFQDCSGFNGNLTVSASVPAIEYGTFSGCSGFTGSLVIPDSAASIGDKAFSGCSGFTGSLTIPESVTGIGAEAFSGCAGFNENLIIPAGVTGIGEAAFSECGFADAWFFGGRLDGAFFGLPYSCKIHYNENASGWPADDLSGYKQEPFNPEEFSPGQPGQTGKYSIAGSVISAETSDPVAGAEISILDREEKVVRSGSSDETGKFELRMDFDPADSILLIRKDGFVSLYLDLTAYPDLTAGLFEGTELAPEKMFSASGECGKYLSWGLTADGTLCFSGSGDMDDYEYKNDGPGVLYEFTTPWIEFSDEIKAVRVLDGSSLTGIGDAAFASCSGLTGSLIIPGSITSIGKAAFYSCSGFTGDLVIPDSVTSIGVLAFYCCTGFDGSLTIPDSVTSIEGGTFEGCSGLTGSLVIPESVTSIGNSAFKGCSGFTGDLVIPDSVTSIGNEAFYSCSGFNGSLTIPGSITSIEESVFAGCKGFTGDLIIPDSVTSIDWDAFGGCSGFNGSLTIPDSVTIIDDSAFGGCSGFTGDLVIPDSVTSIGEYAFGGCGFADAWFFGGRLGGVFFGLPSSCTMHYSQDASGWPADADYLSSYKQEPFDPAKFQFPA